jgi:hypothetical protein
MLYLGIFVILSPAFDPRFYDEDTVPPALVAELVHAVENFLSLLNIFSAQFVILLDGDPIAHSYVFERLLAEFAAACVVFGEAIGDSYDEEEWRHSLKDNFKPIIEDIVREEYPDVFPYYARCLDRRHKDFFWTGPKVEIFPRSDSITSIIPSTSRGEVWDSPTHSIYITDLDPELPTAPTAPNTPADSIRVRRRRSQLGSVDLENGRPNKRQR